MGLSCVGMDSDLQVNIYLSTFEEQIPLSYLGCKIFQNCRGRGYVMSCFYYLFSLLKSLMLVVCQTEGGGLLSIGSYRFTQYKKIGFLAVSGSDLGSSHN